jgi:hypothetical protein
MKEKHKMTFELNEEDVVKYEKWYKKLPKKDFGAIGGGTTFCFTPTGLGDIIKVVRDDGYELDLTDYDHW